jgi:hypothetical protein
MLDTEYDGIRYLARRESRRRMTDSRQSNQYPNSFEYSRELQRSGGLPAKISSDENESKVEVRLN